MILSGTDENGINAVLGDHERTTVKMRRNSCDGISDAMRIIMTVSISRCLAFKRGVIVSIFYERNELFSCDGF